MQALAGVAIILQDNSTLIADVHSIMIAQWILSICILLVVLGLVAAAIAAVLVIRGLQKKVEKLSKEAQAKAMPLIGQGQDLLGKVQEIVADLKPKIASVTTDITHMTGVVKGEVDHVSAVIKGQVDRISEQVDHISGVVKVQVDHISEIVSVKADEIGETVTRLNGTVQDVNGKTQSQVQRVNGMVSEALTTTENVSRSIQHGITLPIVKIAGWVASAKSGIESLAEKIPFLSQLMEDKPAPKPPVRPVGSTAVGGPPFVPAADKKTDFWG